MPYIGKKPADIIATVIDTTTGTFSGEVDAGSLDVSGNADIDGTTNLDNTDIDGTLDVSGNLTVDTNTLFVDSSNNRVGIGTVSPSFPLSIQSSSNAEGLLILGRSADDIGEIEFRENDNSTVLGELQYQQNHAVLRHRVGELRFATGGTTERMRIDSSGNLLVGTTDTSPWNNTSGTGILASSAGVLAATSGGDAAFYGNRLSSDGDIIQLRKTGTTVGSIGVIASDILYLANPDGTGVGLNFDGDSPKINPTNGTGSGTDGVADLGNSSGRFKDLYLSGKLTNDGTGGINIDTSGNVGIGTSSPDVPVEISVAGSSITNVLKLTTTSSGTVPAMQFEGDSSGTQHIIARVRAQQDDASNGGIVFETENSGTVAERMRIDSSGKVGIGTSSPNAPLNVNGTVELAGVLYRGIFGGTYQDSDIGAVTGGNPAAVQIQSASSNRPATLLLGGAQGTNEILGTIGFYNSGNTDTKRLRSFIYGGQSGGTTNEQGGVLVFGTASDAGTTPSERMRIDSSGNVTLPNDASDFTFNTNSLHIGASADIKIGHTSNNNGILSDNGMPFTIFTDVFRVNSADNSENLFGADKNSSFFAKFDNSTKIATASTGINVTGGISFDAGANYLDDYEEGSGTLTITGTSGGTATTSGGADYQYTKIGNLVSFQFEFNCSSVSGVSGTLQIALPFTPSEYSAGALRCYLVTFDGSPFVETTPSASQLRLRASKTNSATQNILSTGYYIGQITYEV